jgi:DNA-binding NtrC family response regulator
MLFIDDQAPLLMARLRGLSQAPHSFVIDSVDDAADALPAMRKRCPDVVLLDLRFPGDEARPESTGARLLREIAAEFPAVPVVVFTTTLTDDSVAPEELPGAEFSYAKDLIEERRKAGLDPLEDLAAKLREAIATKQRSASTESFEWPDAALGDTPVVESLRRILQRVARSVDPVLLVGERGSDLDRLALAIHTMSGREGARAFDARSPAMSWGEFVSDPEVPTTRVVIGIDRLSYPELMELVRRLTGGVREAAWVVTSEQDLLSLAQHGQFPDELAYGLEQYRVRVPPLREHLQDIEVIVKRWLHGAAQRIREDFSGVLRADVVDRLRAYSWPGNTAELRAVLARAAQFADSNVLLPAHIELSRVGGAAGSTSAPAPEGIALQPETYDEEQVARRLARSIIEAADDGRRHTMLSEKHPSLRLLTAVDLVRHLRQAEGQKVTWKALSNFLSAPSEPALRKMLTEDGLKLRELPFN